jgi:hypothetical protein
LIKPLDQSIPNWSKKAKNDKICQIFSKRVHKTRFLTYFLMNLIKNFFVVSQKCVASQESLEDTALEQESPQRSLNKYFHYKTTISAQRVMEGVIIKGGEDEQPRRRRRRPHQQQQHQDQEQILERI